MDLKGRMVLVLAGRTWEIQKRHLSEIRLPDGKEQVCMFESGYCRRWKEDKSIVLWGRNGNSVMRMEGTHCKTISVCVCIFLPKYSTSAGTWTQGRCMEKKVRPGTPLSPHHSLLWKALLVSVWQRLRVTLRQDGAQGAHRESDKAPGFDSRSD